MNGAPEPKAQAIRLCREYDMHKFEEAQEGYLLDCIYQAAI